MQQFLKTLTLILVCASVAWAQGQPLVYEGQVIDKYGKPVSEAIVQAFEVPAEDPAKLVPLGKVTTDEDGIYVFPRGAAREATVKIVAEKAGYSLGCLSARVNDFGLGRVYLGDPIATGGTVVDDAGKPVSGAIIRLLLRTRKGTGISEIFSTPDVDVITSTTNAEGKFEFKLPTDSHAIFWATAPGKAVSFSEDDALAGRMDVRLTMVPEGKICGVLREKDSTTPLVGMRIQAFANGKATFSYGTTDADGKFMLGALKSGRYTLRVSPFDGKSCDWAIVPKPVEVKAGQIIDVIVEAIKAGRIEIVVQDKETTKPIPGAQIALRQAGSKDYETIFTNANGLACATVVPGDYTANVMANNFNWGKESTISVKADNTAKAVIDLVPELIKGVVTESDGKPIADAILVTLGERELAKTNNKGEFAVRSQTDNDNFVIVTQSQRNLVSIADLRLLSRDPKISLDKGLSVKGLVMDTDGNPIEGATVAVAFNESVPIGKDVTNARGEYAISPVHEKMKLLKPFMLAHAEGYGRSTCPVDLTSAKDFIVTIKPLVLQKADFEISGVVKNEQDQPISEATVTVTGKEQPSIVVVKTDKDGEFRLKGLIKGEVRIFAQKGYFRGHIDSKAGLEGVAIQLKKLKIDTRPATQPSS